MRYTVMVYVEQVCHKGHYVIHVSTKPEVLIEMEQTAFKHYSYCRSIFTKINIHIDKQYISSQNGV